MSNLKHPKTMADLLIISLLTAAASAFVVILGKKWGVLEWLQANGSEIVNKWASCDFCCGFWVAVVLSAVFATATGQYHYLFVPVFSAPITRFLL